jgi:hypothetical protein
MENQEKIILNYENKLQELKDEAASLDKKTVALKEVLKRKNETFEHNLLVQMGILVVIGLTVGLFIANILGISTLGDYGLRSLLEFNLAITGTAGVLLLLINFILIGLEKR